jgi:hypothetical protein
MRAGGDGSGGGSIAIDLTEAGAGAGVSFETIDPFLPPLGFGGMILQGTD